MAAIKKAQNGAKTNRKLSKNTLLSTPKFGKDNSGIPKLPEPNYSGLNLLSKATKKDSINYKKGYIEGRSGKGNVLTAKSYEEYIGNSEGRSKGPLKKNELKYKNGGSVAAGTKKPAKRVGPVDPKGAFTTVQKRTLAGAKGKASLTKDKQLGATKMAKSGAKLSKKK